MLLSLFYNIRKIWNPELFQGNKKAKDYFEGWYFKIVSQDGLEKLAIIPGIAMGNKRGEGHAFIQFVDGKSGSTEYVSFSIDDFTYSKQAFEIKIAGNYFSRKKIDLNLIDGGKTISGNLIFSDIQVLPVSFFSPGIMGWYRFVPYMECYHGLVSMNHSVNGKISIGNREINFDNGTGYTEKDWGRSFPSSWIWIQSNHFEKTKTSFFFSLAKIPWFGSHFNGFLCVLMMGDTIYKFATYTGARIESVEIFSDKVSIRIKDKSNILNVTATRTDFVILKAPVNGAMDRRISESMNAVVHVSLRDMSNNLLFEGTGAHAGMDIVGEVQELAPG